MSLMERLSEKAPTHQWIREHFDYPHDYCLIWPFSLTSSGYAAFAGSMVHRVMCEYRNGPPPTDAHQAAHTCGKGHKGCVNPRHLVWKTARENQFDRRKHGTSGGPRCKLTPEQVDEIRSLQHRMPTLQVAERFRVTEANVRQIWEGKIWKRSRAMRIFTEDEVRAIRNSRWPEKSAVELASEYGATRSAIDRIRQRLSYKYVPDVPALGSDE